METRTKQLVQALVISNAVSMFLFLVRVWSAESYRFWFLFWNLWLAMIPLGIALWLRKNLRHKGWFTWQNILLTFLWLGFLPNSFYILTDLIHVHYTGEINILYDAVLFFSCIFNAFVFGFMSLYVVHKQLLKRLPAIRAHGCVGLILAACSFAIYLGRYLRWNTWDAIFHPFGILFDVTDRIINPAANPQVVTTTLIFFLLLSSMYAVIWQLIAWLRAER